MDSIQKLFVRAQWAKAMADLGFNEACVAYYSSDDDDGDGVHVHLPEKPMRNDDLCNGAFTAPTYQQAIDWFRDNHHIEIVVFGGGDGTIFEGMLRNNKGGIIEMVSLPEDYDVNSYHARLNRAIQQTIQLITNEKI